MVSSHASSCAVSPYSASFCFTQSAAPMGARRARLAIGVVARELGGERRWPHYRRTTAAAPTPDTARDGRS